MRRHVAPQIAGPHGAQQRRPAAVQSALRPAGAAWWAARPGVARRSGVHSGQQVLPAVSGRLFPSSPPAGVCSLLHIPHIRALADLCAGSRAAAGRRGAGRHARSHGQLLQLCQDPLVVVGRLLQAEFEKSSRTKSRSNRPKGREGGRSGSASVGARSCRNSGVTRCLQTPTQHGSASPQRAVRLAGTGRFVPARALPARRPAERCTHGSGIPLGPHLQFLLLSLDGCGHLVGHPVGAHHAVQALQHLDVRPCAAGQGATGVGVWCGLLAQPCRDHSRGRKLANQNSRPRTAGRTTQAAPPQARGRPGQSAWAQAQGQCSGPCRRQRSQRAHGFCASSCASSAPAMARSCSR